MESIQTIIIGAIQGISEFLPVSSSGHLVLLPYLFKWKYNGLSFDIALHFGTVIALIAFFWKDWIHIISNALNFKFKFLNSTDIYPKNLLWLIIIGSIPAGIIGIFAGEFIDSTFHSDSNVGRLIIALNLIVFGLILYFVDKKTSKNTELNKLGFKDALIVGIAQSLALMPGVSRSGITITASRSLGLKREAAARFSFLLATPAMLGAFILSIKDLNQSDLNSNFYLGVLSSTIFSFFAIGFLLNYLKKSDFKVFVWYRIFIALVVLATLFIR